MNLNIFNVSMVKVRYVAYVLSKEDIFRMLYKKFPNVIHPTYTPAEYDVKYSYVTFFPPYPYIFISMSPLLMWKRYGIDVKKSSNTILNAAGFSFQQY